MGIIEKLIGLTPFSNSYKKYRQAKVEQFQQEFEAKHLPLRIDFYKKLLQPNDLVFDIGANVGNRVEAFLKCGAKVIAVEPQPSCIIVLKEKFQDKIVIENVGLSEEPGELEMQISTDSTVSTFSKEYIDKTKDRFKYSKWNETIKVQITTLETLLAKYGVPKFCKIDVEGYEVQVLKGLKTKLPLISIEYCVPELEQQLIDCLQYLNSLESKSLYNYSIGETMEWALKEWKSFDSFIAHVNSTEFINTSNGDVYIKNVE